MGQFKDKKAVSTLLREAILQLCRVSVGMHGNFTIDGIICIGSSDQEDQEFVVKIHEKAISCQEKPNYTGTSEVQKTVPDMMSSAGSSGNPLGTMTHTDPMLHSRLALATPSQSKQPADNFVVEDNQMAMQDDNDVEILDIPSVPSQKHLFGDIDNFSDIECTGCDFDEVSFSDVVIKPDPGMFTKMCRSNMTSQKTTHSGDDSSDEELQMETLKAGRVRKSNKSAYTDVDGAPVQVLSAEEFKRILKSEKLKRSRDKSPDFVNAAKALRTTQDVSTFHRRQMSQGHKVAGKAIDRDSAMARAWNPSVSCSSSAATSNIVKYKLPQHYGKQIQNNTPSNAVVNALSQIQNEVAVTVTKSSQMIYPSLGSVRNDNVTENKLDYSLAMEKQNQTGTISDLNKLQDINMSSHLTAEMRETSAEGSLSTTGGSESLLKQNYALQQVKNESHPGDSSVICLDVVNKATESKVHECPVCANVFDTFRLLDLHMYRLHPGMFLCPVCGKSFKQRSTRNRHIVALHSSGKNFTCHLCNATFTRTDTLKKHFDAHHPDVAFPRKSYSYAKGMSILSAEQRPMSNKTVTSQEQTTNPSGETKHNLYTDNFITPIQVTAAVESTDPLLSGVIPSTADITNITPYLPESVSDPESRCPSTENGLHIHDKFEHTSRGQVVSVETSHNISSNHVEDLVSGSSTSSIASSSESCDSARVSLHSVTHIKPIDVGKHFSGLQQSVHIVSQAGHATANPVHNSTESMETNVDSSMPTSGIENHDENHRRDPGNTQTSLDSDLSSVREPTVPASSTVLQVSGIGQSSEVQEDSVSVLQPDESSNLGTVSSTREEAQNEDEALLAKSEDSRTGFMDTIEISDEDNSEQM